MSYTHKITVVNSVMNSFFFPWTKPDVSHSYSWLKIIPHL